MLNYRYIPKKKFWGLLVILCIIVAVAIFAISCSKEDEALEKGEEDGKTVTAEKAYNIPAASEENDLLKIATSVEDAEQKVCYLTFDDGPTEEVTPQVLDVLKKYNIKATFFMLGKMLNVNRELGKRVYDEGHLLANHSYFHVYEDLYATSDGFIAEIEKTQQLIKDVTGEEPFKLIRFPGGGHNAGSYGEQKQEYKNVLKEKGYYFADWNCLNGDAEAALRSPEQLLQRVKETAVGKNIIVLMHDAATKTTTPEALGSIIEYLKGQGYKFKRLDEIEYYSKKFSTEENDMIL